MMSTREREQLQRAQEIAARDQVEVVGAGYTKDGHRRVYAVPSRSEANRWHLVTVDGERLSCDCPQATKGRKVCAHRAAVRARILEERRIAAALGDDAADDGEEPEDTGWTITPRGRDALRGFEATQAQRAQRETAPLYRDNKPFSIWK